MSPRLILDLVQRPIWLAGLGTVILSFVLMAVALGMGQLASVQPILVLELPLTLLGASKFFGSRLGRREWTATAVMTAGLAGLIVFLAPTAGNQGNASGVAWAVGVAVTMGALGGIVAASFTGPPSRKPALLGVGTGITFGLTSAFMKGMTTGYHHGFAGVFLTWQTYAMVLSGLAGMFLMQNALQAGRLIAAQPGITLADPAVAIIWGVLIFREGTRPGLFLALAVVSGVAMAAGGFVLSRSPLLEGERATDEPDQRDDTEEHGTGGSGTGPGDGSPDGGPPGGRPQQRHPTESRR